MADDDFTELEERINRLPLDAKLRLIERVIRGIRLGNKFDPEAFARDVAEMAKDLDLLREMGMAND
jgi:hypothetical protein